MISMKYLVYIFFGIGCTFFLIFFLEKKKLLLDNYFISEHKIISKKKNLHLGPPLCGGLVIFFSFLIFQDLILLNFIIFLFLIIGILSDTNLISSPKFRFILQIFSTIVFVIFLDLKILDIRIILLNEFLQINLISIIFSVFCILILVNGTNFIDGLNTLASGYFMIITFVLILLSHKLNFFLDTKIFLFLIILTVVFVFNFFGKIYLGDSGSYVVAILFAYFSINFIKNNELVSPYFICLLLWYPAFENLFSILRRVVIKQNLSKPDNGHLHQLFFFFLKKKYKLKSVFLNTATAFIINFINFIVLYYSSFYYNKTKYLVLILFFLIAFYSISYFFLMLFKKNKL